MSENHIHHHTHNVYDYEKERIKFLFAIFILSSSLIVLLITMLGFTNGFSDWVADFLYSRLGYTNQWSTTYGPKWFYQMNKDISALGGGVLMPIAVAISIGYFAMKRDTKKMWKFIFVVCGGGVFLIIVKMIFAENLPYEPREILFSTISTYPSGHTVMATIFYLTVATFLTRRQRRSRVRTYTIISAGFLIFIIGISRILGANHTPTEVLAGWAIGLIWLCTCWIIEKYLGKQKAVE